MWKRNRGLPSPSVAIALFALIVAVGGGTFALAKRRTLNPKIVRIATRVANKQITKRASGLSVNFANSAGTAGSADNAKTADNATNASHAVDATNSEQLGGTAANHYVTPSSTLASGDTEVGVFAAGAGNADRAATTIEFIPKLAVAPDSSHTIEIAYGNPKNAHCPGFRQAQAGYLCVYEAWSYEMTFQGFYSPFSENASSIVTTEGTALYFDSSGGSANVRGNWAYTAP